MCDERQWQGLDGDALAELYDKTISELLDHQVPVQLITCRRRPSSTWFDDDCRKAKRALRASEKAARRAGPLSNIDLYRLLERGAFNDASTSNCFARSVLRSGPHASMPSSRSQAAYGGPSMSCLAVGVYRRLQISARRTCTVSSTTRSPEYVLPLLTCMHRLSPLPQSAVCCGCFQLSLLLMSWRQ